MKANEVQKERNNRQEGAESADQQVGQLKAAASMPPAEGPDTAQLRQLQAGANASQQVQQLRAMQQAASASTQVQQSAQLQRAAQLFAGPEVQRKAAGASAENKTGMPDALKSGIESLSGMDMSDVRVHYNSDKPAQLQAHAFAQGSDIHIAPGQEQHLGHEAWHVVQQRQGRVQPTTEVGGQAVNDDAGLEHEADTMGAKALQAKADPTKQLMQGSRPSYSAQLVAQLWQTGRADKTKENKETALDELKDIEADDVNPAMERVEKHTKGTLARYKGEYKSYLGSKDKTFQWPMTYLRGRASRKNGRIAESGAIQSCFDGLSKNNTAYDVHFDPDGADLVVTTIPDFVSDAVIGDVKNVKTLSFTQQLRAIYAMAKGHDIAGEAVAIAKAGTQDWIDVNGPRDFDLIVRSNKHSEGKTELSGPLVDAVDTIWYAIEN